MLPGTSNEPIEDGAIAKAAADIIAMALAEMVQRVLDTDRLRPGSSGHWLPDENRDTNAWSSLKVLLPNGSMFQNLFAGRLHAAE